MKAASILIIVLVVQLSCGKNASMPQEPAQNIEWTGIEKFREWGQAVDGFFGISTDLRLHVWKWDAITLRRHVDAQLPKLLDFVPLRDGVYLACLDPAEPLARWPLTLASVDSNAIIKQWDAPSEWWYPHTGGSRNGNFAVVIMAESDPRDGDHTKRRIGMVEISSGELRWLAELNGREYGAIRQVIASDDGHYIAIGGWDNGAVVVDASDKKMLWAERPSEAVGISYVSFSPGGDILYEGDSGGAGVYAVETKSGKILRRWYATKTGKPIYGHRISWLATSPDGAWIAAGTGPEGQVFLFNARDPQSEPIMLDHGHSTIVMISFSPDSTRLASVAGGLIKIWEVPVVKTGASQPGIEPPTQPANSATLRP